MTKLEFQQAIDSLLNPDERVSIRLFHALPQRQTIQVKTAYSSGSGALYFESFLDHEFFDSPKAAAGIYLQQLRDEFYYHLARKEMRC